MRLFAFGLTASVSILGCQGDKTPTDTGSAEDFTAVRDEILVPSCGGSSCHGTGAGGLTISAAMTAGDLVGVPSALNPVEILVIAGNAEDSYLVRKMEGRIPISGEPMPPPNGAEPDDIERIRSWIDAGAQ